MDHIFLDLGLTSTDKDGEITAIAVVRTDGKGKNLTSFSSAISNQGDDTFSVVMDDMLSAVLASNFVKEYVVVAAHAETDRAFLKSSWKQIDLKRWTTKGHRIEPFSGRKWIDVLQLAWPLVYNNQVSDGSFDTLCKYFGIENVEPDTAMGDCEALVRCYWKMMQQYKVALYGENLIRDIGGKGYSTLVSFFK